MSKKELIHRVNKNNSETDFGCEKITQATQSFSSLKIGSKDARHPIMWCILPISFRKFRMILAWRRELSYLSLYSLIQRMPVLSLTDHDDYKKKSGKHW